MATKTKAQLIEEITVLKARLEKAVVIYKQQQQEIQRLSKRRQTPQELSDVRKHMAACRKAAMEGHKTVRC